MRLLERIALKDVKFPGPLIMLSKVIFTLDGILRDIGGSSRGMGFTIARHVAQDWIGNRSAFRSPLKTRDWAHAAMQRVALFEPLGAARRTSHSQSPAARPLTGVPGIRVKMASPSENTSFARRRLGGSADLVAAGQAIRRVPNAPANQ